MYTINIKVESFNADPNKDTYFSGKKQLEIQECKNIVKEFITVKHIN